ncbi:stigma-specific STIG1-like protein 1 [Abrus precatorius]|uniref:Stigma-specific STIG1-like protein 1 n=1 Tax=Abrus precatorius TaxID=3816 RepID=A0A8B8MMX4_ABRPR|nr:stigma-specific STIG1-like protein 1 [Abrus precatorius]
MTPRAQSLALVTLLMLLLLIKVEGNSTPKEDYENVTNVASSSPKLMKQDKNQAIVGCRNTPWICSQGEFPPRSLCCGDLCVDITTDRNNCGLCGIRCPYNWLCCNRLCRNTNLNPFNCGSCGRICPIGRFCIFGFCAYQQPFTGPPLFPPLPPQPPAME